MIQEKFGKRIKKLREKRNLSQFKFAYEIDMNVSYLATVEAGKRNISLKNIEKIAKGFDISISELFKEL